MTLTFKVMTVEIKGKEIELRYTIKGLILFETLKKSYPDSGNLFDTVALLWAFLRAEVDRKGYDIELTLDDFVEWLDAGENRLKECTEWLTREQARQTELLSDDKKKV